MKKIILVLMFSLGFVSAANAESVCNSYNIDDRGIGDDMSYFDIGNDKAKKDWDKLIMRYHSAEIKKSDKETLCIYMETIAQGYLDIQLTPQEIERFERFLVEKNLYKEYESDRENLLKVLKFFKYHNKLDNIYNRNHITISYAYDGYYFAPDNKNNLAMVASRLERYENKAYVIIKKFVYGKNMGDYFPSGWGSAYSIKELKGMDNQDAKNIAKWAESKLKVSK